MNHKSIEEISNTCNAENDSIIEARMCLIDQEFRRGFDLMSKYPKSVSIFGSARLDGNLDILKKVENLSKKIANLDFTIVAGGGLGIMRAANKGAFEAESGKSIGINIKLPHEQIINGYVHESIDFEHFYSRKVILSYSAEAYIFCPGGFGTLDELFEILTLMQTNKIPRVPVFLYGSYFWNPLQVFFKQVLLQQGNETISNEDLNLYKITDDDVEILEKLNTLEITSEM